MYSFRPSVVAKPESEEELAEVLRKHGRNARIVAGGTGIYELSRRGLLSDVDVLVDISKLQLSYIKEEGGKIIIGAATSLETIQRSSIFSRPYLSALRDACLSIQPLQVKNVATLGGALCTALPFLDMPVALFSLEAIVTIGPDMREMKAYEFVKGFFDVDLKDGEYLREVSISMKEKSGSSFMKFSLTSDDWAIANCSVSVVVDEGLISSASIFVGGAFGEKPVRAVRTEERLRGILPSDTDALKNAIDSTLHLDAKPETDVKASSEYRMDVAKVLCRRAVFQAYRRVMT